MSYETRAGKDRRASLEIRKSSSVNHPSTAQGVGEAKSWDTLVEQFRALRKPIEEGLEAITDEALAAEAPFSPTDNPDETIGSLLAGLSFHEAYHAGQIGLLRRIVGKQGAIGSPRPEVATA